MIFGVPQRFGECTGMQVVFDSMRPHLDVECPKRPVPPTVCGMECGWMVNGGFEDKVRNESRHCPLYLTFPPNA